jgi:ribosomal protein S18 acetylase RimI-like enzyme
MPPLDVVIRRAVTRDLPSLGRLGAQLIREHHSFDRERFMAPSADAASGYAWFLGSQLTNDDVAVLVAERGDQVAGYVYAAVEPRSWERLLDEAGVVHDVVVDERFRRAGIATALLEAVAAWFGARGVRRMVLSTAERNDAAQRLFARLGFRRTMIEMTRELPKVASG